MFVSYLISIAIRLEHITQGVLFMCGMDSATSSPALGQVHGVGALSGGMNTEWVNTHTHSGRVCAAGRQKVPLVGTEKYKCSV